MAEPHIDELFGQGGGAPTPRTGWIHALLILGIALSIAGLLCTSAPGGIVVLLAWLLVEQESDRLESGYLPSDCAPALARARSRTWAGIVLVVVIFFVQTILLCTTSFYEQLYVNLATPALESLAPPPVPAPPP